MGALPDLRRGPDHFPRSRCRRFPRTKCARQSPAVSDDSFFEGLGRRHRRSPYATKSGSGRTHPSCRRSSARRCRRRFSAEKRRRGGRQRCRRAWKHRWQSEADRWPRPHRPTDLATCRGPLVRPGRGARGGLKAGERRIGWLFLVPALAAFALVIALPVSASAGLRIHPLRLADTDPGFCRPRQFPRHCCRRRKCSAAFVTTAIYVVFATRCTLILGLGLGRSSSTSPSAAALPRARCRCCPGCCRRPCAPSSGAGSSTAATACSTQR